MTWIVVFYIVASTGQWAHGECFNIGTQSPADYVYALNNYRWLTYGYEKRGQTTFTWLPCDPNLPLHELTLDAQ